MVIADVLPQPAKKGTEMNDTELKARQARLEIFLRIALPKERSGAFFYREQFRHKPNAAAFVWDWLYRHYWRYLVFVLAGVAAGLAASDQAGLGRSISGAVVGAVLLSPAIWSFFSMRYPGWYPPKQIGLELLGESEDALELKKDPNLYLEKQVLSDKPDGADLAHIVWAVTKNLNGQKVRRALLVWSSLD